MQLPRGESVGMLIFPGRWLRGCAAAAVVAALAGCGSTEADLALGVGVTTMLGAQAPSHEIEQIYYFGVFDPQDQLPPAVYRVRVHGQASFLSFTNFASGWVPASVIDSLGGDVSFKGAGGSLNIDKVDPQFPPLKTGRRLMMFGPEGFREAPRDHRLVIVMGSSPEDFFNAVDQSLGVVSQAIDDQRNAQLARILFEALAAIKADQDRLAALRRDVDAELPKKQVPPS